MPTAIVEILALLAKHYDLIALVVGAIESGKISSTSLVAAVKESIKSAADAEMAREFPGETP